MASQIFATSSTIIFAHYAHAACRIVICQWNILQYGIRDRSGPIKIIPGEDISLDFCMFILRFSQRF